MPSWQREGLIALVGFASGAVWSLALGLGARGKVAVMADVESIEGELRELSPTFAGFIEVLDPAGYPILLNVEEILSASPLVGAALGEAPKGSISFLRVKGGAQVPSSLSYENVLALLAEVAVLARGDYPAYSSR